MYEPKPMDTSKVQLPPGIDDLLEKLAAHNHDIWSQGRIADGWTWGPQRDDAKRQNPCLVPYDELPEKEKEYDRNTALAVLRAILALGYRIERA